MAISFEGGPAPDFLRKLVQTGDVPTIDNKAQEHGLNVDGGVSPYEGIFYNQTAEAAKVNLVDRVTAGVDMKSILTIAAGLAVLLLIIKVSK